MASASMAVEIKEVQILYSLQSVMATIENKKRNLVKRKLIN